MEIEYKSNKNEESWLIDLYLRDSLASNLALEKFTVQEFTDISKMPKGSIKAIHNIISNTAKWEFHGRPGKGIRISLSSGFYTKPKGTVECKKINRISYRQIKAAFEFLVTNQWITKTESHAYFSGTAKGRQTLIQPGPKLMTIISEVKELKRTGNLDVNKNVVLEEQHDLGLLKFKENGESITQKLSSKQMEQLKTLRKINKSNLEHVFSIGRSEYSYLGPKLIQDEGATVIRPSELVYNRCFSNRAGTSGGRLFNRLTSSIQTSHREEIFIDGKKTVEFDYSSMHVQSAYAVVGQKPPEDSYNIFDESGKLINRSITKSVLIVLLCLKERLDLENKSELRKFAAAVTKRLTTSRKKHSMYRNYCLEKGREISIEAPPEHVTYNEIKKVAIALMKKHEPIERYFFSDSSGYFQYLESEIAIAVMNYVQNEGGAILSIHDGFLTTEFYTPVLSAAMVSAYQNVLKTHDIPKFDKKY